MPTTTKPPRLTLAQIKAANKAAGQHFFDRDTLRFFGSQIYPGVYQGVGGVYFVDKSHNAPSGNYNIRRFFSDGTIKTQGTTFTLTCARMVAKQFAADPNRA